MRYRNPAPPLSAALAAFSAAIPLTAIYGPTSATAVAAVYAAVYIYGSLKAKRYVIDVLLASPLELLAMLAGVIHRPKRFYVYRQVLKLQVTRLREESKNPSIYLSMIFLAQHGKAYTEAEDPERRLTPEGIAETEKVARHFAAAGVRPAEIIHSGKTRARQTAEILARHLGVPVREGEGLGPNDDPTPWALRLSETDNLMVVGHLPHLSRLAALLLTGDPSKEVVKFRYSGVLALTKEQVRWSVAWYITPDIT